MFEAIAKQPILYLLGAFLGYNAFQSMSKDDKDNAYIDDQTSEDDSSFIQSDSAPVFVFFFVNWCGYCKQTKPEVEKLGNQYHGVDIKHIDCEKSPEMAQKHDVKGFPTMKLFPKGINNTDGVVDYNGPRKVGHMKKFIQVNKIK
jgi:thioredoxin-like negative regulator of GroEL